MNQPKTAKKYLPGPFLLSEGLCLTLKKLAKQKRVRVAHLVEHLLAEVVASGLLEALCRDIVPLPSEQALSAEEASKSPQSPQQQVPRRASAVRRRLDGERKAPNRLVEFEKLKTLYQYPGTHLDEECESAKKYFLENWGAFSEQESEDLEKTVSHRLEIYEHWLKSHAELSSLIADAEKRLTRNTGRAHRMINAELRRLRALRAEFEATVRWKLRGSLVGRTM